MSARLVFRRRTVLNAPPPSLDSSWELSMSDLRSMPFAVHGLIAVRAQDGSAHCNLRSAQVRWRASLDWGPLYTPAVERLATAALSSFAALQSEEHDTFALPAHGRGLSIAQAFAVDCLCSMPMEGGWIPLEAFESWWEEYVR